MDLGGNISQEEDYESIGINGKGLIYADKALKTVRTA
ncbi:DUF3570 domain-containing protein [Vibrio chagasii]|nr:DUF3570 domain-containing protein [Vibrio chagasii]